MGTGAIIWTLLALTVHQGQIQEYPFNRRDFSIPIKLDVKRALEVQDLILLVSKDQGNNWEQVDRKPPTEKNFVYHALADGSYWFIVQQVNRNGQSIPDKPARVKPNMVVLVDTAPPQVKVTAERKPDGKIHAQWTITDLHPDPQSVRLDYHTSAVPDGGEWVPIGVPPSLEGLHAFDPGRDGLTGEVRIRVRVKDQAGNVGEGVAVVQAAGAGAVSNSAAPMEAVPFSVIPNTRPEPPARTTQLTSQSAPRPAVETPPAPASMPPSPTPPAELNPANSAPLGGLPIAANNGAMPASSGGSTETSASSSALKIVQSRQVRLDFTVAKVGPSGLGNADIYVTMDKGATWKKMPGDVPITLSPNSDNRGSESVSGSVSVQLPAEATIYGFIVAAKSKAGLAPPPPKPGDPPEALVELDTTAPKGHLFKPQPDPTQPNTLLLGWEAKDRNLTDKPITLEWAEQKDGPWKPIGEGPLPNSGQFSWRLPDQLLPPNVYLRLTMRDLAGNESRAQTDKPVLIDLSVPQTKIINVGTNAR